MWATVERMTSVPRGEMVMTLGVNFDKSLSRLWMTSQIVASDDVAKEFVHLHMFASLSMRMLVNMVPQAVHVANLLAEDLRSMPDRMDEFRTVATIYGTEFSVGTGEGRKRFDSVLQLVDGGYGPHGYQMFPRGFGRRAKGIEEAGRIAALGYASHLAGVDRPDQGAWLRKLGRIGVLVADGFTSGAVDVGNQHLAVAELMRISWEEGPGADA